MCLCSLVSFAFNDTWTYLSWRTLLYAQLCRVLHFFIIHDNNGLSDLREVFWNTQTLPWCCLALQVPSSVRSCTRTNLAVQLDGPWRLCSSNLGSSASNTQGHTLSLLPFSTGVASKQSSGNIRFTAALTSNYLGAAAAQHCACSISRRAGGHLPAEVLDG